MTSIMPAMNDAFPKKWTDEELDAIATRETTPEIAKSLELDVYAALMDRHGRLTNSCKRCPTRPRKCPWNDGLLHVQQIGVNAETKDGFFTARCDNPGCPSRRAEKQHEAAS